MKAIENDFKEFAEAISTIERLLPVIKRYLSVDHTKVERSIMDFDMFNYAMASGASCRLLNGIKSIYYKGPGIRLDTITVSDFVKTVTKKQMLECRNLGKTCINELESILLKDGIKWE